MKAQVHQSTPTPPTAPSDFAPAPPDLPPPRPRGQMAARAALVGAFAAALAAGAVIIGWERLPLGEGPPIGGYYCPLCGGTRAWWAFCHGRWAVSFGFNPLVWMLSPVIVYASLSAVTWFVTGRPLWGFRDPWTWPRRWFWPVAIAVVGFTVLRNLPVWPLTWLAP